MRVDDLSFDVVVFLGNTTLAMNTYMSLQVGDIIVLEQNVESPLETRIGSTDYFLATAGLFETHKAITIHERILPR